MHRIHFLQHVPFESPGYLEYLSTSETATVSYTRLWETTEFPVPSEIDLLIIMGGPMNIYEHDRYPWLVAEKKFLLSVIEAGKRILGICLGSQLLADVLGSTVLPNRVKEIGWYPVKLAQATSGISLLQDIPRQFTPFHWHGDTYPVPPGAIRLGSSGACDNQGFIFDNRVVGLQFHLEMTADSLEHLIDACGNELVIDEYVQTADRILDDTDKFMLPSQQIMRQLFSNLLTLP